MNPTSQVETDIGPSVLPVPGIRPVYSQHARNNADPRSAVYIIDSDDTVQQELKALLHSVNLPSEAFGSVADFLKRTRLPDVPSCLVLDVRLPGVSGLDFQESMARTGAPLPVIFLTGHADIPMTVRAMKSGAIDFLTKPFREQDVLDAVAAALDRDRMRRKDLEAWAGIRHRFALLTERERQVMVRVADGRLNKQIAGDLGISEPTVKIHRGSVMRKLNVRTVPDLVRIADMIAGSLGPDGGPSPERAYLLGRASASAALARLGKLPLAAAIHAN